MPDITMCVNDQCPLKTKCYRYMAIPSHERKQSYLNFQFRPDGSCLDFIEIRGRQVKAKVPNNEEPTLSTP